MLATSGVQVAHVQNGQGKRAMTLVTDGGYFYPIISHDAYIDRIQSAPHKYKRGARPMHRTTLTFPKPPWTADDAYFTTSKENFGGSKGLNPVRRPPLCPSMHTSQIKLGSNAAQHWSTHYANNYTERRLIPANRLHLTSLVNRIDQTEGAEVKKAVRVDHQQPSAYWTQYNRIHGKLGTMLGPGIAREYPVRQSYNILTGETQGAAWQEDNKRVSGNRVLNGLRRQQTTLLG